MLKYTDANLISRNNWVEKLSPLKKRVKNEGKIDISI